MAQLMVWAVCSFAGASAAEEFPTPRGLAPHVEFWRKVYVRWDSTQIAFHDREDLSMVYRVVEVPAHGTRRDGRTRRQHIQAAEQELIQTLQRLDAQQPVDDTGLEGLDREVFLNLRSVRRPDKYRRISTLRAQNGLREKARQGWIDFGKYEDQVRAILDDAGLPEELIAVAFVESLFNLYARSHAGAAGMWQFMRPTAKEYMQVHHVLDERHDPVLATEAAAKYLKQARKRLGPWPVAITSYNYGRAGMARAMAAVGSSDLADLIEKYEHRNWGFAAQNYYASFLALLDVIRDPERYFPGVQRARAWQYDVIRLPFSVLANQLASPTVVDEATLARLNPAWSKGARSAKEVLPRGLGVRVPLGKAAAVLAHIAELSTKERQRAVNHVRAWHRASGKETLRRIASRYGVSAKALTRRLDLPENHKPAKGTQIPIPSVDVRYSLIPEARGLPLPEGDAAPGAVATLSMDAPVFVSTRSAPRRPPTVRLRLVSTETISTLPELRGVDAWASGELPVMGEVDAIAGDPGLDAPWPLLDGAGPTAPVREDPPSS